jgi:hypothetical protein
MELGSQLQAPPIYPRYPLDRRLGRPQSRSVLCGDQNNPYPCRESKYYTQLWKKRQGKPHPSIERHERVKFYHCDYAISDYHSNNTFHGLSYVVCHECIVSILRVLIFWCGYVKCSMLYKGDSFRLTVCAC